MAIHDTVGLKGRSSAETRSAILDLIRASGQISRSELARRSALTEKTISGVVKSLLSAGVVIEAGHAASTGGKRPILLRLSERRLHAVGITLDYSRSLIVLCGLDGAEIARAEIDGFGEDEPSAVLDRLTSALEELLDRRGIEPSSVIGIGLASGGRRGWTGHREEGTTFHTDLWETFPSAAELGRRTGLHVAIENDANCAALGHYWTSGGRPEDAFVTVYMAHGIGAGIVIGGRVYRGASGNAGEIGHVQVDPQGAPCLCGRAGCLNVVASPAAVVHTIIDDPGLRESCGIEQDTSFGVAVRAYEQAVVEHRSGVEELFRRSAECLAAAVTDLVNTLDLAEIVLAGPAFSVLGERYRTLLESHLADNAFMRELHPIQVRLGTGADAAALGAASMVLHRRLTPHQAGV